MGGADDGGGVMDTHVKEFPEPPRVGRDKVCGPSWGLEEESVMRALLILRFSYSELSGNRFLVFSNYPVCGHLSWQPTENEHTLILSPPFSNISATHILL